MAKGILGGIFDTIFGRKDRSKDETDKEKKERLKRKKKREELEKGKDTENNDIFDDESMLGKIKKRTGKRTKTLSDI